MLSSIRKSMGKVVLKIRCFCLQSQYTRSMKRLEKKDKQNKIKVVFFSQEPSVWNSVKSVYEYAKNNENIEVFLMAIPGNLKQLEKNEAYHFCSKFDKNVINAWENGVWFDLRKLNPDYIFMERPYDYYLPKCYQSSTLVKYTKLCIVPYGFMLVDLLEQLFEVDFYGNIYYLFAESTFMKEHYLKYMSKNHISKMHHVLDLGFPRFDLIKEKKNIDEERFGIEWITRWTTDETLGGSSFFQYKDSMIQFVKNNKDISYVFRPHPMAFDNYISKGQMSKEEVEEYKVNFDGKRMLLDVNKDYWIEFAKTDLLIADFSSVVIEFFATGKPIVYLGNTEQLTVDGKMIAEGFYIAESWDEIVKYINMIRTGKDPLKAKRREIIQKLKIDGKVGQRIIETLLEDAGNR